MKQIIYTASTNSSTSIVISASTEINQCFIPVGAIKSFSVKQEVDIEQHEIKNECGELVTKTIPRNSTIEIELVRTYFDGISLTEAFGLDTRPIEDAPAINIRVIELYTLNNQKAAVITTYHNCHFISLVTPIKAEDYITLESAKIVCEYMLVKREKLYVEPNYKLEQRHYEAHKLFNGWESFKDEPDAIEKMKEACLTCSGVANNFYNYYKTHGQKSYFMAKILGNKDEEIKD